MTARCFDCSKPMDKPSLEHTDGDLCGTCLARRGTPLTIPCRCGCGRPASPYVAAFVGLASHCASAARVREGWKSSAPQVERLVAA